MYKFKKWLAKNFLPIFIFNKEKRKVVRAKLKQELKPNMSKMKLGVSYNVCDSEELLEASLKSIRSEVDYINVIWMEESWKGEKCDKNLPNLLEGLKKKKLIDEIIFFKHKGRASNQPALERKKKNVGLEAVKKAGCNYYLNMDCDEFYDKEEFANAKKEILARDISYTACPIFDYWKKPEYRQLNMAKLSVPFICKIDKNDILAKNKDYPCWVDGTRALKIKNGRKFLYLNIITMHHMSLVRKDIKKKYDNASIMNDKFKKEILERYNNLNEKTLDKYGFIKVANKFNIKL